MRFFLWYDCVLTLSGFIVLTEVELMVLKYGLKAQKLLAQGIASKQHALKGQKLLAQGIALGIMPICKSPCFTLIEQALSAFFNVNYV